MPFSTRRIQHSERRIGVSLAALAAGAAVLFGASAASAEPSIQEKRRQAELILAQVQDLDAEVGATAERFNGANYELGRLTQRLVQTQSELKGTRKQLKVMLGSESLRDMLDRLDVGERILEQDARIAGNLKSLAVRTKQRERQLNVSRRTQAGLVRQLDSEREAIASTLSERRQLLSSVQAEVTRLEAVERGRQVVLRRRAEAELARQRALAAAQENRQQESAPEPEASAPTAAAAATTTAPAEAVPDPAPAPAPPADASRGAQVVAVAMRYLGVPYKWGGASPSTGFDWVGARRVL